MERQQFIRQHSIIVNSRAAFSKAESNLFYILISKIPKTGVPNADPISVTAREVEEFTGSKVNYRQFEGTVNTLSDKKIFVQDQPDKWRKISMGTVFYYNGKADFFFDAKALSYFFELKQFVLADLQTVLALNSVYARRVYLILKQTEKFGVRYYKVEDLMEALQVPPSLRVYKGFKNKVLKVALKQIAEHTDLKVKLIEEKKGRSVYRLQFRMKRNEDLSLKDWIAFARERMVGEVIGRAPRNKRQIKISTKGLLYYGDGDLETLTKEQSKLLWEYFYNERVKV